MNWNNINLESDYEKSRNILDGYSTETLLLEISCNIREINEETVRKQFLESLEANINSAKEVFEANIKNIVKKAQQERKED